MQEHDKDHLADGGTSAVRGGEGRAPVIDAGPWVAQLWPGRKAVLQSDDFEHDVALIVTGDFIDDNQRMRYAEGLAAQINAGVAGCSAPVAWMPIESAPTNSVDVLVCLNNGQGAILLARTPGTGEWWDDALGRIPTPTHWMPLPAPPAV